MLTAVLNIRLQLSLPICIIMFLFLYVYAWNLLITIFRTNLNNWQKYSKLELEINNVTPETFVRYKIWKILLSSQLGLKKCLILIIPAVEMHKTLLRITEKIIIFKNSYLKKGFLKFHGKLQASSIKQKAYESHYQNKQTKYWTLVQCNVV